VIVRIKTLDYLYAILSVAEPDESRGSQTELRCERWPTAVNPPAIETPRGAHPPDCHRPLRRLERESKFTMRNCRAQH